MINQSVLILILAYTDEKVPQMLRIPVYPNSKQKNNLLVSPHSKSQEQPLLSQSNQPQQNNQTSLKKKSNKATNQGLTLTKNSHSVPTL